jgi:hypothetical protein
LNAKCQEKIWFQGGLECGADKGKVCVVVSALYGLKLAGASWRSAFLQALCDIGFSSMTADRDVWIRVAACDDRFKYYEMILVYVDDVLAISHRAKDLIKTIRE